MLPSPPTPTLLLLLLGSAALSKRTKQGRTHRRTGRRKSAQRRPHGQTHMEQRCAKARTQRVANTTNTAAIVVLRRTALQCTLVPVRFWLLLPTAYCR